MARPEERLLSIVIPALNEEEAIGSTIQRCLDARKEIIQSGGVSDVEIIVVSDGSTDRTEEIARRFEEVWVLGFEKNRGYGAAIKTGFDQARGNLLGFLDADGTCDPRTFVKLCRAIHEGADVAVGHRMSSESGMPWIRSLGNTIFAWILGVLSKRAVGDTASGMRVIRRECLDDLYPLPNGLHFTPAMSARIQLEQKLKLVEVPMPYAERIGRSKLSVFKDGVRFLTAIVKAAICYRPSRPLLLLAGFVLLPALLLVLKPAIFYLGHGRLEEWMIYRFLASSLLGTCALLLVLAAVIAEHIAAVAHRRPVSTAGVTGLLCSFLKPRTRLIVAAIILIGAFGLVWPGMVEYVTTRHVTMHWSRAKLASLLVVTVTMIWITAFLINMMELIRTHQDLRETMSAPDRIRAPKAPREPAPTLAP